MFYTKFTSASKKHILWLRFKINKLLHISGSLDCLSRHSKNYLYQLKYAKKESKILISKIYYKRNLPCLERKRKKIKTILRTDNKGAKRI